MDLSYLELNENKIKLLPASFFWRDPLEVAFDLIGKLLIKEDKQKLIIRLVEVEAYRGLSDPASHAYRGKTKRNSIMFEEPGHLYVYFNYGMYWLANVVCHKSPNEAGAVLLRGAIPLKGIELMRKRREKNKKNLTDTELLSGPGKICQALGIDGKYYGKYLGQKKKARSDIYLGSDGVEPKDVIQTTRIGINVGKEFLWRFCVKDFQ